MSPASPRAARVAAAVLAGLSCFWNMPAAVAAPPQAVSRFGEYSGYSKPLYSEWVRSSPYIATRDGTRLAADVFRPAVNGQPVTDKLPVVWTHTRYQRSHSRDGKL